jgi:hypothetical protein
MKKSTKNIKPRILSNRECKILLFLWKWKVATTLTLRQELARETNFWNFYHTLRALMSDGYIEIRYGATSTSKKFALWHLTSHGFAYIKEELGELEDLNYASTSLFHDSYVVAFHYGNWIYRQPTNVDLFTEQEIKCVAKGHYPHWVPSTKVHRPDGYTRIKNGNRNTVIAIEVELSSKTIERYEAVSDFYDDRKAITHVLWLVSSSSMVETIQHAMMSRRSKRIEDHLFVLLEDFEKNSWNAKIVSGGKSKLSVSELYHQLGANIPTNCLPTASHSDPVTTFLKPVQSPRGLET